MARLRAIGRLKRLRQHRGDIMSPETRSRVMSRIRGKNTKPERAVERLLAACGLGFESQAGDLPGRPDFVLRGFRVAIFVDGDFWHGWRFATWRHKLSEPWELKIEATRQRDRRNHAKLRRTGWTVVRLWEHQVDNRLDGCRARIMSAVERAASGQVPGARSRGKKIMDQGGIS